MKPTSSRSHQRYLNIFAKLLFLYPKSYRKQYGAQMLQLLNDNLRDAERLGDHHTTREVFLSSLFELPGSVLAVYWMNRNQSIQFGIYGWTVYCCFFLILNALILLAVGIETTPSFITYTLVPLAVVALVFSLPLAAFNYTRQFRYSLLVLVPGIAFFSIAAFVTNSFLYLFFGGEIGTLVQTTFLLTVPLLCSFILLARYRNHPTRYRRGGLSSLSQVELARLRAEISGKRKRTAKVVGTLTAVFLIANLVALHDPRQAFPDLAVAKVTVAPTDNAALVVENLQEPFQKDQYELNAEQTHLLTQYITGESWDDTQAQALLTTSRTQRETFLTAAKLPYFQDPNFANPEGITNPFSQPILQMSGLRSTARAVLLSAEWSNRHGQTNEGVNQALASATFGQRMIEGQNVVISFLVGVDIRNTALTYLNYMLAHYSVDAAGLTQINNTLSSYSDVAAGERSALKLEFFLNSTGLGLIRSEGGSPYQLLTYLPYLFQPNQTYNDLSTANRAVLARTYLPCSQIGSAVAPNYNFVFSWHFLGMNSLGRMLNSMVSVNFDGLDSKRCIAEGMKEKVIAQVSALQ